MLSINKVLLAGNLTRDVEIRTLQSGTVVGNFTLAINNRRSDGQEETVFVDVTCWNKTAENCSRYIGKGSNVFLEGVLQMDSWEGQDGKKNTKLKVTAMSVQFVSRKEQSDGQGQGQDNAYAPRQGNGQGNYNMPPMEDNKRGMYARPQGRYNYNGGVNPSYGPETQPPVPPESNGGELPPF